MHLKYIILFSSILLTSAKMYDDVLKYFGHHHRRVITFGCDRNELVAMSKLLLLKEYEIVNCLKPDAINHLTIFHGYTFLLNFNCKNSLEILYKANEKKLFTYSYYWFVFYESTKLNSSGLDYFTNLSILVDSNFILLDISSREKISVQGVFKKRPTSSLTIENLGILLMENGTLVGQKTETLVRRSNLGINLNTCIILTNNDSINHLTDGRDPHIDRATKVQYALIRVLASFYNATLNISTTDSWGYKNKATQRMGLLGELTKKTVDIGGTAFFYAKERVDLIDCIGTVYTSKMAFILRQPKLSYVSNIYILPFAKEVWIAALAAIALMVLAIFLIKKFENVSSESTEPQGTDNEEKICESFLEATFLTVAAVCQQGAHVLPHNASGRIATLTIYVSWMFIYVSYSAKIVALLQTPSSRSNTIRDLLESKLSVGVYDTPYNRHYFETQTEPIKKQLYETKIAPPGRPPSYMSLEEGVRRLRQGLFAFQTETMLAYKLIGATFQEHEKCGLKEIVFLPQQPFCVPIQKNSSFKEMLKIGLCLLRETGIAHRENHRISTKRPVCTSGSVTFFSVELVDCYSLAVVYAGGVVSSLLILLAEIYVHYRFRNINH